MNTEDQKYYDAMRDLFLQDGWAIIVDSLNNSAADLNNLDAISSQEELWHRKGQLAVINNLLSLPYSIDLAEANYG